MGRERWLARVELERRRAEGDRVAFARLYLRTERGERPRYDVRPYLVGILADDRPEHVCIACAQSGKTLTYTARLLHEVIYPPDGRPRTIIYTFPTATDVHEFAGARFRQMLDSSPILKAHISNVDNVKVKLFSRGAMYFRGTVGERQALSVPADTLVHDEFDRSNLSSVQMYSDRTRASAAPHRYLFSTPTVPGYGISAEWARSDQREWVFVCPRCKADQCFCPMSGETRWFHHLDLEGVEEERDAARARFMCADCRETLPREAIVSGRWQAMAPENAGVAGYHITGIMPPEASAERLATEYVRAKYRELWAQGHLGIPAVSGENEITEGAIVFGDWRNTLSHSGPLFAGVDQGKKLDFVAGDGAGRIVAVHRFDDWAQVRSAMRTLGVRLLVGDAQPESRPLQEMAREFPGRVLLADFSLTTLERDPFDVVRGSARVRLHRTGMMDWARDRILMGGDGGDVWPALAPQEERVLISHLCASRRTLEEDSHGQARAVWRETGEDHLRLAHVYYLASVVVADRVGAVRVFEHRPRGT